MYGATRHLITRLSIVGLGLMPLLASALGLGDIQVESRLNQPLRAHIEIVDVTDEEWRQIHARIHQEASLEHDVIHSELLGSISVRAVDLDHRHFIEMRTSEPITEPLFDLPVELVGSKSRLIRSYPILLDPPGAEDTAQALATPGHAAGSAQMTGPAEIAEPAQVAARSAQLSRAVPESRRDAGPRPRSERARSASQSNEAPRAGSPEVGTKHQAPRSSQSESNKPTSAPASAEAVSAIQDGLKVQLDQLQQTLERMQATISAQNEQIVQLSARMSAQSQLQGDRSWAAASTMSAHNAQSASGASGASADDTSSQADEDETDVAAESNSRRIYYWIAGLATIAATVIGVLLWRRNPRGPASDPANREPVQLSEPPASLFQSRADRLQAPEPPAARVPLRSVVVSESRQAAASYPSDRVTSLASSSRASGPGRPSQAASIADTKWSSSFRSANDIRSANDVRPANDVGPANDVRPANDMRAANEVRPAASPPSAAEQTDRLPAAKMPPLNEAPADTEELPEEYLEELPAAYIAKMPGPNRAELDLTVPLTALGAVEHNASEATQGGAKANAAPTVPAEVDPANATAVLEPTEQARALATQDGRSLVNKEIAQILEKSLGDDPGRVDIRLKLLEIYHHEARGNRAEFNSLVRNLIADPRALTPAQRQHVEKLQRTLSEEPADPAGEFVSKVAI